jgi:hypothetical protein
MLERASFILTRSVLSLSLSFTKPGLVLASIGLVLRDNRSSDSATQRTQHSDTSDYQRYPKGGVGAHLFMMKAPPGRRGGNKGITQIRPQKCDKTERNTNIAAAVMRG